MATQVKFWQPYRVRQFLGTTTMRRANQIPHPVSAAAGRQDRPNPGAFASPSRPGRTPGVNSTRCDDEFYRVGRQNRSNSDLPGPHSNHWYYSGAPMVVPQPTEMGRGYHREDMVRQNHVPLRMGRGNQGLPYHQTANWGGGDPWVWNLVKSRPGVGRSQSGAGSWGGRDSRTPFFCCLESLEPLLQCGVFKHNSW